MTGPAIGWKTSETKSTAPKIQNLGENIALAPS